MGFAKGGAFAAKCAASRPPLVTALIVAAGRGTRMGGQVNKQFLPLCGMPVLARTIDAFEQSELVGEVVVVAGHGEMPEAAALVREYAFQKVVRIVAGGETRQQSAAAGLEAANPATAYFAVHDGARPLITPQQIDDVVRAAFETGAASAAAPVKDTIKVTDMDGVVLQTPDRASLWAVQTPQVFEASLYRTALQAAQKRGDDYTDDCQLAEKAGRRVRLVNCGYRNIKITTREDLLFAQALLEAEAEELEDRTRL